MEIKVYMTSIKRQTALQEFWDKMALKLSTEQLNEVLPLFNQAKEIEKEQIKSAFNMGDMFNADYYYMASESEAENYYNETYGGNK
jgi:hypothetical protein